ncbi:MAG: lysine--tRNA ligase [bacterium]|nr:lysine--tRNA ligase [bacterium]
MTEKRGIAPTERLRQDKELKLERLREAGINPYPYRFDRNTTTVECIANESAWIEEGKEVMLAGRLMSQRVMGKSCFANLEDRDGNIQIFLRKDEIGEDEYKRFAKLMEVGDHVGVRGVLFRTRTDELSVRVAEVTLLGKSMLALPEKHHGLRDPELRARQRYTDLAANSDVRQLFITRSRMLRLIREFFEEQGFLEVETPVLQPLYGGASARPFTTQHNALDTKLYMRIANELYLKRLIVGGLDRVFEVAKIFRNEGMDRSHNPEFTMLEAYASYWDYNDLMPFIEELYRRLAVELTGSAQIVFGDHTIDLGSPWERLDFYDALEKYTGRDLRGADEEALAAFADELSIDVDPSWNRGKLLDAIMSKKVEPNFIQPVFLMDHPKEISPLAKDHRDKPGQVERFEPFIATMEVANAFSELNDPAEQRRRFEAQMGLRAKGDDEAQVMDEDFIRALEIGMPPTAGLGIGIDRLVMLLTNSHHIREILLFPMMRPEA